MIVGDNMHVEQYLFWIEHVLLYIMRNSTLLIQSVIVHKEHQEPVNH